MAFGDHRVGVANAQSTFINTQEGYARIEKEAKAQNKELVFIGNFHVKIVPKRNRFEKIIDFFKGEVKAEKRALRDFKVSLPNIKPNALNIKEANGDIGDIGARLNAEIEVKTRRAANTFKKTYAQQSESVSKGEIRSTIRNRHTLKPDTPSRINRTNQHLLKEGGIYESAEIIKTQIKEAAGLKPRDFKLGKQLETIDEESEEEIAENTSTNREQFRSSLHDALENIHSSGGSLEFEGARYEFNESQLEDVRIIAKDLNDSDVDFGKVFSQLEKAGVKLEGPLAQFAKTPDQLAELRYIDTPPKAEAPSVATTQAPSNRNKQLATDIKDQLVIAFLNYAQFFPETPKEQLTQIAQLKDDLNNDKFLNPDESLKLNDLEAAINKAGLNINEGFLTHIGSLVQELKTTSASA